MIITLAGVRGSAPCPGKAHQEFGGHTTCVLVRGARSEAVMIDAGSGVTLVNDILRRDPPDELHILMTHLHLDHIMGWPLLAALYDEGCRVHIHTGPDSQDGLRDAFRRVTTPPVWPVPVDVEGPGLVLAPLQTAFRVGGLEVRCTPVPHPDGCCAWRLDERATGRSLVFATDLEWSRVEDPEENLLVDLCRRPRPADLLVMEGHFSAEQLPRHEGWGHSSVDQCAEVARLTGAGRLLVTHHNPDHDDVALLALEDHLRTLLPGAALARQGQVVSLLEPADGKEPSS